MTNWIMLGTNCLNLDRIDRIMFPDADTAVLFFAGLEARHCSECGDPAEGLEQAWLVLEGEDAMTLRRYMGRTAIDARTPVPTAFQHEPA